MDRVWTTSKYWTTTKSFATLCQVKVIQGHDVKKVILKKLCLGDVIHVFNSDFHQEPPKMILEHFLNVLNRTKFR